MTAIDLTAAIVTLSDAELTSLKAAVEAEVARRASAPCEPRAEYYTDVRDGCIDQADVGGFETHRRGKNWMATVVADKTQPGGLRREFWRRASGSWCHLPEGLKAGDVIEVAHEYVTGAGRNDKDRNYVKVVAVTNGSVYFDDCGKPQ